jgi:hypothetical protein
MRCKKETSRRRAWYPVQQDVTFRVLGRWNGQNTGAGRTISMSSKGVLFSTDRVLLPGRGVELCIDWPGKLNSGVGLKLVVRGRIVSYVHGAAGIAVQRYQFRTRTARAATASP